MLFQGQLKGIMLEAVPIKDHWQILIRCRLELVGSGPIRTKGGSPYHSHNIDFIATHRLRNPTMVPVEYKTSGDSAVVDYIQSLTRRSIMIPLFSPRAGSRNYVRRMAIAAMIV